MAGAETYKDHMRELGLSPAVPTVGRAVHYTSRGSADGVFPAVCRAATITAVHDLGVQDEEGNDITSVDLCVMNPTGLFFDQGVGGPSEKPGLWHWPEMV